jgi:hypothetical protein
MQLDPFAVIAIILVILIAVVFLIPGDRLARRRKKKREDQENKDWQGACLKLERHIHALRREIESGQKREKILERDLTIQKEKHGRLQEKLSQERAWQNKESGQSERQGQDLVRLTAEIKATEQTLAQEHGENLRLQKALKESQDAASAAADAKLDLEAEIARLKALSERYRQEILELREQNAQLSKKHDESTWVAKSEYQKLEKQLEFKDRELGRLKEQLRREML